MRRLFIAINLPENIKKVIEGIVNDLKISVNQRVDQRKSAAKIRFLPKENWHLTISFLGYQPDEAISPIIESLKETVKNFSAPLVEFEKIIYGPPNKSPRMIWLVGAKETSKILSEIKNKLEDELIKDGVQFKKENRGFNCHLTLARFQYGEVRLPLEIGLPNTEILSFAAQSLDLMESHLKRAGAEYEILVRVDFTKET